jgi:hypothetical protein
MNIIFEHSVAFTYTLLQSILQSLMQQDAQIECNGILKYNMNATGCSNIILYECNRMLKYNISIKDCNIECKSVFDWYSKIR